MITFCTVLFQEELKNKLDKSALEGLGKYTIAWVNLRQKKIGLA